MSLPEYVDGNKGYQHTDILDNGSESDEVTTDSTALSNTARLAKIEMRESHTSYKNGF